MYSSFLGLLSLLGNLVLGGSRVNKHLEETSIVSYDRKNATDEVAWWNFSSAKNPPPRVLLQPGNATLAHFKIIIQVRVEVFVLENSELLLAVRLEKLRGETTAAFNSSAVENGNVLQSSSGSLSDKTTEWVPWSTDLDNSLQLDSLEAPAVSKTLAGVQDRKAAGVFPTSDLQEGTNVLVFNAEFESLPPGEYRAAVLDMGLCRNGEDCAVVGYSNRQLLHSPEPGFPVTSTVPVEYGTVEMGLQFTTCPDGSECLVPGRGVVVREMVRDARGQWFDHERTGAADRNGYLALGGWQGARRVLRFTYGSETPRSLREDAVVAPRRGEPLLSLGVLPLDRRSVLCAPSPRGEPREVLIRGQLRGVAPESSRSVFLPGMQCYWQIVPPQPVREMSLQLLSAARDFPNPRRGTHLQVYTLTTEGDVRLMEELSSGSHKSIQVGGSQLLLHFSASEEAEVDDGFQVSWRSTRAATASQESWFDSRVATIMFAIFAAAAYGVTGLAAWKWWHQRMLQQQEEANRHAAREAQRNERRRFRADHRRRRSRGLPAELIARLPTTNIVLADLERDGGDEPSCSICLSEYEDGDKVTWLPCSHNYHCACVSSWLKNSTICPICKDNVKRSLLKTLSLYRELHRTGMPQALPCRGGTSEDRAEAQPAEPRRAAGELELQPVPLSPRVSTAASEEEEEEAAEARGDPEAAALAASEGL
uniref:E3 ubiquitin-protein ligase RNF13 n=1 Tax=Tetraselmis sp. GSL018 TaxID=582737 RepID=A0A061RQ60_9CHLO